MKSFEYKPPPPVIAALLALAMWGVARIFPLCDLSSFLREAVATPITLLGAGFSLAGIVSFRRARTTVNPMKPETASFLVCTGIYCVTRNPMYVGLLFVLLAWAVYLSSAWALLGPLAFFIYIDRFQIPAEERALLTLFGDEYMDYKTKVRRWL